MFSSKSTKKKKKTDEDQSDSDTSLEKYCHDDESITTPSSSTSTTSRSSPAVQPRKSFLKKPAVKAEESPFDDEMKPSPLDDNDPPRSALRRPSNPLARADAQFSLVADSPAQTMHDRNQLDGTLFSTMKLGSDTLDEEQEKAAFYRGLEQDQGDKGVNYGLLNRDLDELSPTRGGATVVLSSFDQDIHQMSTPMHSKPTDNTVKESVSDELDRELEHDSKKAHAITSTKNVNIAEPPVQPATSITDLSKSARTMPELHSGSGGTRQSSVARISDKQYVSSTPATRITKAHTYDPKGKSQTQKATVLKSTSKPSTETPSKKGPISALSRPQTAPAPVQTSSKDSELIEQLKIDKEMLQEKLKSVAARHDEELRSIREENYALRAQINQLISANNDGKTEPMPPKQREVSDLEKLIDGYQAENEKLCKQIKHNEQQHKQIQQAMFDENEKLRQELVHAKMTVEQYETSGGASARKQPSTIVLTNLSGSDADESEHQRLKKEIIVLQNKLAAAMRRDQHNGDEDDTLRSLEQRRIKDLERQVKELEMINRRRQQSPTTQVGMVLNPLDDRNQLTIKLHKTEQTLREQQASEAKLLHEFNVLQEQYALMKQMFAKDGQPSAISEQFEKQMHDALSKSRTLVGHGHLRRENERLKNELEKLKTQQIPKSTKSLKRDLETIKLLRHDLERKNDELDKLRALYDAVNVQHKSLLAEREREKTRLAVMGNKPYQPDRFTQVLAPAETLHAENEQLKHLVEKLEHDAQEQHAELLRLRDDRQAAIAVALREKNDENLRLRQQHKAELQTVINEISGKASETRVTDLLRKIDSQDATIAHLRKLTEHADESARELAVLRTRDDELETTIHRLQQELCDARTYHTPEMKHFQELQSKIQHLEERWSKRDQISKDYTTSIVRQHDHDVNSDVNKLRAIIKQKNQEIERFHLELDSMLELLKTLKFQQLLSNR